MTRSNALHGILFGFILLCPDSHFLTVRTKQHSGLAAIHIASDSGHGYTVKPGITIPFFSTINTPTTSPQYSISRGQSLRSIVVGGTVTVPSFTSISAMVFTTPLPLAKRGQAVLFGKQPVQQHKATNQYTHQEFSDLM
mgnify:CR=1 FL=1